jgi:hypothetical protein
MKLSFSHFVAEFSVLQSNLSTRASKSSPGTRAKGRLSPRAQKVMELGGRRFAFAACEDRPIAQDDETDEAARHGVRGR